MFTIGLWNFDMTRFVGKASGLGMSSQLKDKSIIGSKKISWVT
jgi:hypothetical protein